MEEVVAEPYVQWQEPESLEDKDLINQLAKRNTKHHRITTSSDSDSEDEKSGKSKVSEIKYQKHDTTSLSSSDSDGLDEIIQTEDEFGEIKKVEEIADEGLVEENVNVNDSKNTYQIVSKDGSVTQSSEVAEESVTTTIQETLTIITTQHKTFNDVDTEPLNYSSPSVQDNVSHHSSLNYAVNVTGHVKKDITDELGDILEGETEPIDYNVEGLLKKQETHELICPNCLTCITRKVILKKRKRVNKDDQRGSKKERNEAIGVSEIISTPGQNDEVITCWSCFSLLTPSGSGLKIFKIFGRGKQPEVVSNQTPLLTPDVGGIFVDPSNTFNNVQGGGNTVNAKTNIKEKDEVRISIKNGHKLDVSNGTPEVSRDMVIPETARPALGRAWEWDILKSIVYGGLVESITSLGVVSSAAGAETATINVLAMGMANLIGGLILVFNNLKDLKKSATDVHSNRYYENLGRRNNITLHAIVVVFSFIIFGLVPVATYAFTFRSSDNRDYKSLAVAGVSFICITLLSIGKAHTENPRTAKSYFKSITYNLSTATAASGLSYIAGKLLQELIEKTGWFDTTSSLNSIISNSVMPSQPAWGS